jgi:alpha-beta hydrolase superfamily lysophospholipase
MAGCYHRATVDRKPDLKLQRRREDQSWILDYVIANTGVAHNFEYEGRHFPASVKRFDMIPKTVAKQAMRQEALAHTAEEAGHRETAALLYFKAAMGYRQAQHMVRVHGDPRKAHLYGKLAQCYDKVVELSAAPIERIEAPWEGKSISGLLHLLPDRRKAPLVIFLPGMDMTKESFPDPLTNPYRERGMHVLSIDGPGVGASNMRGVHVTHDNFERAVSAVIEYAVIRPEVEAERIAICGVSMGSFWAARSAAYDDRIVAAAVSQSCLGGKKEIFETGPPDFKQQFMYMAGIQDEETFDREVAEHLTALGFGGRINCPMLIVAGEFDPIGPLQEAQQFFQELAGPKELWVLEDEFHFRTNDRLRGFAGTEFMPFVADWLRDALHGKYGANHDRTVFISQGSSSGPYTGPSSPDWYA